MNRRGQVVLWWVSQFGSLVMVLTSSWILLDPTTTHPLLVFFFFLWLIALYLFIWGLISYPKKNS